jgi:ribonucleoside-diphosphate reductase alpha chain
VQIKRRFTVAGASPYRGMQFESRSSGLTKRDGTSVFSQDAVVVPTSWDQTSTDILAQKYFRRRGCDHRNINSCYNSRYATASITRSEPSPTQKLAQGDAEFDLRQTIHRIVGCWTHWGEQLGYFNPESAQAFYDEMSYMMASQMFAPASPQWFNTGLAWAYGITGEPQGHFFTDYTDPKKLTTRKSDDAYTHPATGACFIQSIKDDLVGPGGIMDLWTREARIFKYGGGSGSNFSKIRGAGEPLSGGGVSSGLISFLRVGDRAAGAIKSGGTSRRAAKLVCLDLDHPDIEEFIGWKVNEERKVAMMVAGSRAMSNAWSELLGSAKNVSGPDPQLNPMFAKALRDARRAGVPDGFLAEAMARLQQGRYTMPHRPMSTDWEGEAYDTISAQNANNSVRIPDTFMAMVQADGNWNLTRRVDGVATKTIRARALWDLIAEAAWSVADPGIQFDTTYNAWNTCPEDGRIASTNPCSEYAFLDDTACLTPETRISTPGGLRSIESLYHSQQLGVGVRVTTELRAEFDHHRLTAHRPAVVTYTGEKTVFRVSLSDGRSVRATANHKFLDDTGSWVRVDQLVVGQGLQIRELGTPVEFTSNLNDISRWRMLGWLTGDGIFSNGVVGLVFGPKEQDTASWAVPEFLRLREEAYRYFNEPMNEKTPTLMVQANGVMQITSGSKALIRYLEEFYGFHQGTAIHKDVPSRLLTQPGDQRVAYLIGLFSADGCIRRSKSATAYDVSLATSAPALMSSVQLLLSDFGITARAFWFHPKGRTNTQGQLRMHNGEAMKFLSIIGFECSSSKKATTEKVLGSPFLGAARNPRTPEVVSVTPDGVSPVYDITEPVTHSFIAEGIITHNCNLGSLNLVRFLKEGGEFDVEAFTHACELMTIALDITVSMSQYPFKIMAENSCRYRTLGGGYANLGGYLMRTGRAYDSEDGVSVAAEITSLMTGVAYHTSARLAAELGAFPAYTKNRAAVLNVLQRHQALAHGFGIELVDKAQNEPVVHYRPLRIGDGPSAQVWDEAVELVQAHGLRNAQVTVLAPTGTIGILMGCDTTGVEPDFALVKFKKLAGGGYMKLVNQGVPAALRNLGYSEGKIDDIVDHISGESIMQGHTAGITKRELLAAGYDEAELHSWDEALKTAFDPAMVLPVADLEKLFGTAVPAFLLDVGGRGTIEGAPHLKPEHLAIFDCASRCGQGTRFISPMGHLNMMAAVQPFLSGSISKTVNVPNDTTIQQVGDLYLQAWAMGIKSVAIYRDGSKLSQPMATSLELLEATEAIQDPEPAPAVKVQAVAEQLTRHAIRQKLPSRRGGYTQAVKIGGSKFYLRTGEYEDGTLGEIFLDAYKEGTGYKALLNAFAIAISIGLQHGVPLEEFCDAYLFTKFEPNGMVQDHDAVKMCLSVLDFIFRDLAITYLRRFELANVKPEDLLAENGPKRPMAGPARPIQAFKMADEEVSMKDLAFHMGDTIEEVMTKATRATRDISERDQAKAQGYTGDTCTSCGHLTMVRNGTCLKCLTCGGTSGCS